MHHISQLFNSQTSNSIIFHSLKLLLKYNHLLPTLAIFCLSWQYFI